MLKLVGEGVIVSRATSEKNKYEKQGRFRQSNSTL